ncbi:MAG: thioesterase family protein [bacterium]
MNARTSGDVQRPSNAFRTNIQVRFADTDALGHLNNGSFVIYSETARLEFARRLLGAGSRALILAHLSVDFRRQVRYDEPVHVYTWIERIGRTSAALRQTVYAHEALAADVKSVIVSFDYTAQQPTGWTDDARAAMLPYQHDRDMAS